MNKISATLITLNEERNIARAIESLRCCDEVLVLDSGSSDATLTIAARLGARVLHRDWDSFAGQKNAAAHEAAHDWVLSLDADEAVSEPLDGEIWALKQAGYQHDGYTMPRLTQYLGRWILHSGWYPDRKVRFYDRRKGIWTGEYVHESVTVAGSVGALQGDILHFTCNSLSDHLRTTDRYTTLAATELNARGKDVTFRHLLLNPPWSFVRAYLLQRGFLDGFQGFTIAYMAAFYTFLKYAKARAGK